MIIYCQYCNESLSCSEKSVLCEDCIEQSFEDDTGQLCSSKSKKDFPEIIICPSCLALAILEQGVV